jgi:hypothetical protein
MNTLAQTVSSATEPRRRPNFQFALSTLLLGMFMFALFFGFSAFWWQRVQFERAKSQAAIEQLQAALHMERLAHQEAIARLLLARSQLQDAIDVRLERELASRLSAESDLQSSELSLTRLRTLLQNAEQELQRLRNQPQRAQESAAPQP